MRGERATSPSASPDTGDTKGGDIVCHVVERLTLGGAEMLVHRLSSGLRARGYGAVVFCLEGGRLQTVLERDGIPVVCMGRPRPSVLSGPRFAAYIVRAARALAAAVRENHATIIHAHLPDSIILGSVVGALCRVPAIGTYHGPGMLPAGRARYDPRNLLRKLMYRLSEALTAASIAVSPAVREKLCRELGFSSDSTVLIMNGVDTRTLSGLRESPALRRELGLAPERRIVTCVGRLVRNKGQRFLIDAIADVVRRHPDAALVLVGGGPDAAELEHRIRSRQLENDVVLAGERDDVPDILAMTDLFVLPSFAEGIPLALIEAMACGKPVVATRVEGIVNVITNDDVGVLVPPRDSHALADAICSVLADSSRASSLGHRGQLLVQERFDFRRTLDATAEVYQRVLTPRRPRAAHGARE